MNNDICAGWSHRPVQMPPHRGAVGPPPTHPVQMPHICTGWWLQPGTNVLASHLYRAEPPPDINVATFVPGKKKAHYKFHSIETMGGLRKNCVSASHP
jgi:hypothetical protein